MAKRKGGAVGVLLIVLCIVAVALFCVYKYITGDEILFDIITAFQKDAKCETLSFTLSFLDDLNIDGKMKLSEKPEEIVVDIGGLDPLFGSRIALRDNQIYLDSLIGSFGSDATDTANAAANAIAMLRGSKAEDAAEQDYSAMLKDIPYFGELIAEKQAESEAERAAKFDSVKYDECTKKLLLNLNRKSYWESFCDSVTITKSDNGEDVYYRFVINSALREVATVKAYKDAYLDAAVYESELAAAEAKRIQSSIDTLTIEIKEGYLTAFGYVYTDNDGNSRNVSLTVSDFDGVVFETEAGVANGDAA